MCHKIESFFQSITSPKSHKEMIGRSVKQGRKEGARGAGMAREARGGTAVYIGNESLLMKQSIALMLLAPWNGRKLNSDTVMERGGKRRRLTARTACACCCCYCYYYYYYFY